MNLRLHIERLVLDGPAGDLDRAALARSVTQELTRLLGTTGLHPTLLEGPVPVLVATATIADVPVYIDGVGTTRALNTVTVVSQVDGKYRFTELPD